MLEDVLNRMNAAQYQATTSDATVLQILAGPGSGKTRVLTTRVAWLVKERNVDPDTILVVTFTNKAANEMRNRLQTNDLLGSESMRLMMGTFHSKCSALLRRYGNRIGIRSNFTIADTAASDKILETVLKELPSEFRAFGKPSTYRGAISKAKAQDMTCDIYDAEHRDDLKEGSAKLKTSIVYRAYQKELLNNNALDFDDLLMEGCRLLEKDPSIADSIGYILVDEYQDTNLVQYNLIKLLSRGGKHITIVGDPDQSIYGFRNADVSNFRKMQTDYDNVVTINLEENYRSTTHILDAASVVIQHDTDRLPKSLYTNNCLGVPISWLALPTPDEEAKEIVNEIVRLEKYSNGILTHDDFCILVRINSHSRPYESALNEMKIPYRMRGGLRFFDRAEVKDVIAYLRLVSNPYDSEAFTRIINVPKRGIGDVTVKRIKALAERKHLSMLDALAEFANTGGGSSANRSLPQATVNEMGRFLKMMNSFRALAEAQTSIGIITETVIRESNIQKYLQNKYAKDGKEIFKIHWSNIEELLNFAQRFNESSSDQSNISQTNSSQASTQRANSSANTQNVDALVRFLDSTSLDLDSTNEEEENDTKQLVTISTYHSAKGLEWPCVFATGCEEGVIPFVLCTSEKEIQEECRLLYVGMTRAQCFLYVTEVTSRYNPWRNIWYDCSTTQFLADLADSLYQRKFPRFDKSTREWLAPLLDRPLPEETCVLEDEGGTIYNPTISVDNNRYRSDEGEEYDEWDDNYTNDFEEKYNDDGNRYRTYDRGYQSTSFYAPSQPKKQNTKDAKKAAVYEGRKQSAFGVNTSSSAKKSLKLTPSSHKKYNANDSSVSTGKRQPSPNDTDVLRSQNGIKTQIKKESPYSYPTKSLAKQSGSQSFTGFTSAGSLPMDQPFKGAKGSKRKGVKREKEHQQNISEASKSSKKVKGQLVKNEGSASEIKPDQWTESSSQRMVDMTKQPNNNAYNSVWSKFLQKESQEIQVQRRETELSEMVIDSLQRIPNERGELSREHAVAVVTDSAGRRNIDVKQQDVDKRVGLELQKLVDQGILCKHRSNTDIYLIAN